jgi:hypothetical protein
MNIHVVMRDSDVKYLLSVLIESGVKMMRCALNGRIMWIWWLRYLRRRRWLTSRRMVKRKRRKQNGCSDAPYFQKYVKNRVLKLQMIHFRGMGKYVQKDATVYTIQKYRGKGCKNTGMEMFSAGKLYDTNDNMLLTRKQ